MYYIVRAYEFEEVLHGNDLKAISDDKTYIL